MQQEVIKAQYFIKARQWYYNLYIAPLAQRSILLVVVILMVILTIGISAVLYNLFPLDRQVMYTIKVGNAKNYNSTVLKASPDLEHSALKAIADRLAQSYVITREDYEYANLAKQMRFVHNFSTAITYKKFYNYINIENPQSPVLRYQKYATRQVKILSRNFIDDDTIAINFHAIAIDDTGAIIEDMKWQATIGFNIDPINLTLADGTPYNFLVTYYKLKLLDINNAP